LIDLADNELYSTPKLDLTAIDHTETATVLSTDNIAVTSSGIFCATSFPGRSPDPDLKLRIAATGPTTISALSRDGFPGIEGLCFRQVSNSK